MGRTFTFGLVMHSPFSIAFSPCPNDTFMFDGLVNQRLQENIVVDYTLLDIEQLNEAALEGRYDFTKLSMGVYPLVADTYQITSAGCALGYKCGPILIAKPGMDLHALNDLPVAIPGMHTTANLYMGILFPQLTNKKEYLFSEIENAVLKGEVAAGLIIHENRFTYAAKGMISLADLGTEWEKRTGLPVPLGCIAVKRSLPEKSKRLLQSALHKSIELAFANPSLSEEFVAFHSQELSHEVQQQHIALYVNNFSLNLGEEGEKAIRYLFREGAKLGLLPDMKDSIFLNDSLHVA